MSTLRRVSAAENASVVAVALEALLDEPFETTVPFASFALVETPDSVSAEDAESESLASPFEFEPASFPPPACCVAESETPAAVAAAEESGGVISLLTVICA